jgi:ribosomal protein S27E
MSEPMSTSEIRCPWCSAVLPDAAAEKCPQCGAQLTRASGSDANVPGVTALDPEAILRARSEVGRSRGGLLGFLTGRDLPESDGPDTAASLAPPDDEVRREMLRLQLEAEQADAVAESVALRSDVLAERGIHLDQLNAIEEQAEAVYESEVEGREVNPEDPLSPTAPTTPPAQPAAQPDQGSSKA